MSIFVKTVFKHGPIRPMTKGAKMSAFKEAYIIELEKEWSRLEDEGVPSERAYELAQSRAYDNLREKLAEQGDLIRIMRRGH